MHTPAQQPHRKTCRHLTCRMPHCLQLEPALVALEEVMQNLRQVLDARVFVSLGRGLWDCTAREVFDYTEELQEEHHKVKSQALSHLFLCVAVGVDGSWTILATDETQAVY